MSHFIQDGRKDGLYLIWQKKCGMQKKVICLMAMKGCGHMQKAAPDEGFSHLAVEVSGGDTSNEWCEPVADEKYSKLA